MRRARGRSSSEARAERPGRRRSAALLHGRRRLPARGGARCAELGRRARLGAAHDRPATTRSRCSAPAPSRAGASPSSAAPGSTASASRPTAGTSASPRSARSPATGAAATTSGSPRSRAAARSDDGRGPKTTLEQRGARALRPRHAVRAGRGDPRASEIAERRLLELPPVVFAEAEHDAVAAGIVDRLADEVVALARARSTGSGSTAARSRCCSAAGCSRARIRGVVERIRSGLPGIAVAGVRRTPPIVGAALLALDELGAGARGAGARARQELARRWSMAEVHFRQATRIYPGTDDARGRRARPRHRRRRVHGAGRAVGLGQDDRAADARRARGGRRRRDLHRRPRRHRPAAEGPRRGDGLPELRALPVPDRRREHRLPAQDRAA